MPIFPKTATIGILCTFVLLFVYMVLHRFPLHKAIQPADLLSAQKVQQSFCDNVYHRDLFGAGVIERDNVYYYLYNASDAVSLALARGAGHGEIEIREIMGALTVQRGRSAQPLYIDVGANVGSLVLPIAKAGYRTLAFEGMKQNLLLLRSSICRNKLSETVTLVGVALGNSTGLCYTLSQTSNRGDGITACDEKTKQQLLAEGCELRGHTLVRRMDDLWQEDVDVMKIDVEGHEQYVLQGASKLIQSKKVWYILIEVWQKRTPLPVLATLMELYSISFTGFNGAAATLTEIETRLKQQPILNLYLKHKF